MVILQCSRCTSSGSLSEPNRATNGHRVVFQSSEVLGTERHYIPNEKGIIPFVATGPDILNTVQPHTYPTPQLNIYHTDNRADSYGQIISPIDSLSTAPGLEFAHILDYSQQQPFEHDSESDSWTVSLFLFFYIPPSNALPSYSTVAAVYILLYFNLARPSPFLSL